MAVTPIFDPNLSGAYGNIQDALRQGADIASKRTGVAGTVAAGLEPLAQEAVASRQAVLKANLEDHLKKNEAVYAAQAAGKSLTTPDGMEGMAQQAGLDPKIFKDTIPDEGVWQTPEERQGMVNKLKRQDVVEQMAQKKAATDPWGANLLHYLARTEPSTETDQLIARMAGVTSIDRVIDPATGEVQYVDHLTKQPIAVPGSMPSGAGGGIKDIPSLHRVNKFEAEYLQGLA